MDFIKTIVETTCAGCVLGFFFSFFKGIKDFYNILSRKYKGDIYKGKIVELKQSYSYQNGTKIQKIHVYSVEVDMYDARKLLEYKEFVKGKKDSRFKLDMLIDVYVDKQTKQVDVMMDLWEEFKSDMFGITLCILMFIVMALIDFYVVV